MVVLKKKKTKNCCMTEWVWGKTDFAPRKIVELLRNTCQVIVDVSPLGMHESDDSSSIWFSHIVVSELTPTWSAS